MIFLKLGGLLMELRNNSYKNLTSITLPKLSSGWQKIAYRIFEKNNEYNFLSAEDPLDTFADVYQDFLHHLTNYIIAMNPSQMQKVMKILFAMEL